jgi:hypothetical protein
VGFVLDRRKRRKARKTAALGKGSKSAAMLAAAKPMLDTAIEMATHAAETAKPKVEHAVEVAKPKVDKATKSAKVKAGTMAEQAKPHVIDLTDKVSERMTSLKDLAADGDRPKQLVVSLK